MDAAEIVDEMRTLVLVVESDGSIVDWRGGFGGFLGLDLAGLAGSSVFDHVAPDHVDELATYFIENVGESAATIALPMPFRVSIIDADGVEHPVDVIPTGHQAGPDSWRWIVVVVPVALNGSISRSLDLEMAGGSRDEVRTMLCEELLVDNDSYTSRWMLVDLDDPTSPRVITARTEDAEIAALVERTSRAGWSPWNDMTEGAIESMDPATVPESLRAAMDGREWRRCIVTPVHVDGELAAAYVMLGRVPSDYFATEIKSNVASRIRALVQASALLFARWNDRDRLTTAATCDSLTGLANRASFFAALSSEEHDGALLYIDLDDFKTINDGFGHEVGDRVLVLVAERIVQASRDDDIVARIGGDEFVVLLRDADIACASTIARRIIDTVRSDLDVPGGPERISVSVGLSTTAESDDALDAADRAMLLAKRRGRGRLVVASHDDSHR